MAARLDIRRVKEGDAALVADNMRLSDRIECELLAGMSSDQAVSISLNRAVACWTVELDGEVVALFGINRKSLTSSIGMPWLLATDRLEDMGAMFVRASMEYRDRFRRAFPQMENYIHVDNTASIVWLRWLGFDMGEPVPTGLAGEPFIRFSMGMP